MLGWCELRFDLKAEGCSIAKLQMCALVGALYAYFDISCWWGQAPPDWQEILTHFRVSELQNYFTRLLEDDLKAIIKPQYVDNIPKAVRWARACLSLVCMFMASHG